MIWIDHGLVENILNIVQHWYYSQILSFVSHTELNTLLNIHSFTELNSSWGNGVVIKAIDFCLTFI